MKRLAYPEGQVHLWPAEVMELHTGKPCRPAPPAPLPELAITESDEISSDRAGRILGTSINGTRALLQRGLIQYIRKTRGGSFLISYKSVVAFCDSLCVRYAIQDQRRPQRSGRYLDKDLLPFPFEGETVFIPEVAGRLRLSEQSCRKLCEDGTLVSYRLHESLPWRISRASLAKYIAALNGHGLGGPL